MAAALPVLAFRRAGAVIDLALGSLSGNFVPRPLVRHLGTLARRAPERIGEILFHPGFRGELLRRGLPAGVLRRLRHLPAALVRDLARLLLAEPGHLAALLEALPPSRREAVFHHACDGVDFTHRCWPVELLAALPHAVRDAEAQRMLGLRSIRQDSARALEITSYRDVETARGRARSRRPRHLLAHAIRDRPTRSAPLRRRRQQAAGGSLPARSRSPTPAGREHRTTRFSRALRHPVAAPEPAARRRKRSLHGARAGDPLRRRERRLRPGNRPRPLPGRAGLGPRGSPGLAGEGGRKSARMDRPAGDRAVAR